MNYNKLEAMNCGCRFILTKTDSKLIPAKAADDSDLQARNIRFDSVYDTDVPPVNIVQDQLLQVLLNLLINAVDAMHGEGMIRTTTSFDGPAACRFTMDSLPSASTAARPA